jgi:hypothetical protein
MDHGAWRRHRTCTWSPLNTSQHGDADAEGDIGYAPPRRSGYGDTLSFGLFKAWNWSLRLTRLILVSDVPPATPTCAWTVYVHYRFTFCEELPGRLQRLGTMPTPATAGPGRRESDVCLRDARRRITSDVKIRPFSSYCWLRSGDTRPGPRPNSLLRLNRRWTALLRSSLPTFRPTYVPAYLLSGLPTRHQLLNNLPGLLSISCPSGTSIFLFM